MKARNTNEKYRKIKDAEEEEVKKEIEGRISIKKKKEWREKEKRERGERAMTVVLMSYLVN